MQDIPRSKFLKVICPRCKTQQILFGKSSLKIKCNTCNLLLTKPTGGKTKIKAQIKTVIWRNVYERR
jgi:small subunit ribosomal protein S27e